MDNYQASAIIGYWRCGASLEQISALLTIHYDLIFSVVHNYKLKNSAANDIK